jgi:hypothetical protein
VATQATNEAKTREQDLKRKAMILLNTLYDVALDTNESTQSRVSAAKTFLAKTMPDLKAIDHSGDVEFVGQHFIFRKPD